MSSDGEYAELDSKAGSIPAPPDDSDLGIVEGNAHCLRLGLYLCHRYYHFYGHNCCHNHGVPISVEQLSRHLHRPSQTHRNWAGRNLLDKVGPEGLTDTQAFEYAVLARLRSTGLSLVGIKPFWAELRKDLGLQLLKLDKPLWVVVSVEDESASLCRTQAAVVAAVARGQLARVISLDESLALVRAFINARPAVLPDSGSSPQSNGESRLRS